MGNKSTVHCPIKFVFSSFCLFSFGKTSIIDTKIEKVEQNDRMNLFIAGDIIINILLIYYNIINKRY